MPTWAATWWIRPPYISDICRERTETELPILFHHIVVPAIHSDPLNGNMSNPKHLAGEPENRVTPHVVQHVEDMQDNFVFWMDWVIRR